MSFTLGLAIFGGGIAVGLRAYVRAVIDQERSIRDTMAAESAAAGVLGELAAGGTIAGVSDRVVDGRTFPVLVTSTSAKIDLVADAPTEVVGALRELGGASPRDVRSLPGLADLSTRMRLGAAQEDCLRRTFTYGRGGQPRVPPAAGLTQLTARAGDQMDVRVGASRPGGPVLWLRARFTGDASGWRLHDYRALGGEAVCPTGETSRTAGRP